MSSSRVEPTSQLPRLRSFPDAAHLQRSLDLLAALYSPGDCLIPLGLGHELEEDLERVRFDPTERHYAMDWLMKLISSGVDWIDDTTVGTSSATDPPGVESILDRAGRILASDARLPEPGALDRTFSFPRQPALFSDLFQSDSAAEPVTVTLKDLALPPSEDTPASADSGQQSSLAASAVGVQTWAASIVMADLLVRFPSLFHASLESYSDQGASIKVVELGAGTGLVGLIAAIVLGSELDRHKDTDRQRPQKSRQVYLTDYHPAVLAHLRENVRQVEDDAAKACFPPPCSITVDALDWSHYHNVPSAPASSCDDADLLLATDVVYSPDHAAWLYSTMRAVLKKPRKASDTQARAHVLCAKREHGRFGEWDLVRGVDLAFGEVASDLKSASDASFGVNQELQVVRRTELPKVKGLGRKDENGWVWWELAWVQVR